MNIIYFRAADSVITFAWYSAFTCWIAQNAHMFKKFQDTLLKLSYIYFYMRQQLYPFLRKADVTKQTFKYNCLRVKHDI